MKNNARECPGVSAGWGPGVVTAMARVTAVAQVQFLAGELPPAMGVAKEKRKKKKKTTQNPFSINNDRRKHSLWIKCVCVTKPLFFLQTYSFDQVAQGISDA